MRGARATLQSKTDGGTPADTVMAVEDQDTKYVAFCVRNSSTSPQTCGQ